MANPNSAEPSPDTLREVGVQANSVAEVYSTNPFSSIISETLESVAPGADTSDDFKRGFEAAKAIIELRGAAVLEAFVAAHDYQIWEYGWRSFFANGEEYEWLATNSREEAEQQIKDYQEEENRNFGDGKLTYSLWKRLVAKPGPWVSVED